MSLSKIDPDDIQTAEIEEADVPDYDELGLPIMGDKPLVGSLRREKGMTVVREEIADELDL